MCALSLSKGSGPRSANGPHGVWPAAILGAASRRTTEYRPAALLRQADAPGWRSNVSASPTSRPGRQPGTKSGGGPAVARAAARSLPSPSTRLAAFDTLSFASLPSAIAFWTCLLDIGQLRVGVVGPQTQQIAACSQRRTAAPAIPTAPDAPAISRASLTSTPEKPSSPRSRSSRTIRLIVAGCCSIQLWQQDVRRHDRPAPASMAAANGSSSRSRSCRGSGRPQATKRGIGAVSPWPGKCLAVAAMPVDWRPRTQAAPCRATGRRRAEAAHADHRVVGVGVDVDVRREGERAARMAQRPAHGGHGLGDVKVVEPAQHGVAREGRAVAAKSRVTSPPSSSMAMIAYGFAAMIESVRARSCVGEEMFSAKRQTPPNPARSRSRSQPGSTVPANPGSRVSSNVRSPASSACLDKSRCSTRRAEGAKPLRCPATP